MPFSRGPERSRPFDDIVDEARALAAAGYREVTLLGQNVNSYGHDLAPEARFAHVDAERWAGRRLDLAGRPDLAELIRAIDGLRTADGRPAIGRLRFVTSHPWDLSDRLIAALADCDSVCEHLHLPVQSGVGRGPAPDGPPVHGRALPRSASTRIREAVPGIAISTDIIVGFCGETEAQFEETLALLETVRYDQVFAAAYSPRPGTPATHLADDVPAADKRRRLNDAARASRRRSGSSATRRGSAARSRSSSTRSTRHAATSTTRPRRPGDGRAALRPDPRQQARPPRRRRGARRARGPGPHRPRRPVRAARRARRSVTEAPPLIVIAGATATGKTELAIRSPRRSARAAGPWRSSRPTRARSSAASTSARPRSTRRRPGARPAPRPRPRRPGRAVQRRRLRDARPGGPRRPGTRRRARDPRRRHRPLPARRRARPRHRRAAERSRRPRPARGALLADGLRRRSRDSSDLAPALAAGVDPRTRAASSARSRSPSSAATRRRRRPAATRARSPGSA